MATPPPIGLSEFEFAVFDAVAGGASTSIEIVAALPKGVGGRAWRGPEHSDVTAVLHALSKLGYVKATREPLPGGGFRYRWSLNDKTPASD